MTENVNKVVQELPREVIDMANGASAEDGLLKLLENILVASREIGDNLRSCGFSSNIIGTPWNEAELWRLLLPKKCPMKCLATGTDTVLHSIR
eukprot:gene34006-38436_t